MENTAAKKQTGGRNPGIELMRIVFCVVVLMFHMWKNLTDLGKATFFPFMQGRIGVEFFFMVSGFLMALHIEKAGKKDQTGVSIPRETVSFVWKKYASMAPFVIPLALLDFIVVACHNHYDLTHVVNNFLLTIPNFLLLQDICPAPYKLLPVTWYISVMLLSMMIIYPIGRKKPQLLNCIIAPIGALIIFKIIFYNNAALTANDSAILPGISIRFARGFADILLGCVAFEISKLITNKVNTKKDRILLTVGETALYAIILLYACFNSMKPVYTIVIMMIFAIAITFSGKSVITKYLDHKVIYFLGKATLPIYILQQITLRLVVWMKGVSNMDKCLIFMLSTIVLGIIYQAVVDKIRSTRKAAKAKKMSAA